MPPCPPFLSLPTRRRVLGALPALAASAAGIASVARAQAQVAPTGAPVLLGIDGEFGLMNSTSAQAVELGTRIAIAQINPRTSSVIDSLGMVPAPSLTPAR